MAHELVVTYGNGYSDTVTCDTFAELSGTIDKAMASPGFVRYEVRPGCDR